MKIVLAYDSFKETMSSELVAEITKRALLKKYKDAEILCMPVSDGGEGSVEAIVKATNSEIKKYIVKGPHFEDIEVIAGKNGDDYYVESASVVGFKYRKSTDTPNDISSFGIGDLIKQILDENPKNIYICLGGTTSTDGGCGMAAALGAKFYDKDNKEFIPVGVGMNDIVKIDLSGMDERIRNVHFFALSDVTNPLYGENGASYVYSPQKGASPEQVVELDNGLINLSSIIREEYNKDCAYQMGSGAAGGLGYACMVFLQAKIKRGIETILDICNFDDIIRDADYVFTGEGKLDSQSFQGKVLMGIVNRASMFGVKVIGVFGKIDAKDIKLPHCVKAIYETNKLKLPFSEVKHRCKEDLEATVEGIEL